MGNPEIDKYGIKRWFDADGNIHRADGPAIEDVDGTKIWQKHGLLHRDDGPACEFASGDDGWDHENYERDGNYEWWLNSIYMSFDEWLDEVDISDEDKVMMKLQYG
jgi:hypothetical protein